MQKNFFCLKQVVTIYMRRRLEKNNLGFSHVFFANLSYILSNILHRKFPICICSSTTIRFPNCFWLGLASIPHFVFLGFLTQFLAPYLFWPLPASVLSLYGKVLCCSPLWGVVCKATQYKILHHFLVNFG